ncbi:uncharacterized protein TNCV_4305791 [Trichonephila clavipes]|nr:uncharacterized protein TNCV_4305791 [Trichonephila clavipes]
MTLHSSTENSLAVLNHKILEANSQVQNVKLGGHQTCLSINRLWHELCDMLRRLVGTTTPDIMIVQFRNEKDKKLFLISSRSTTQGIFSDFKDSETFDDGLPTCVTGVEEIVHLSKPMNSDSDAEIDNDTPVKSVTFSNSLHYLETEDVPHAAGCK